MNMRSRTIAKIPPEILHDIHSRLDELLYLLKPYLIALTPPERRTLSKIGTESIKFLEMSHQFADKNPGLFPAFRKAASFREEFYTAQELRMVISKIDRLKDTINDTEMLAGNYALETALIFYNIVKIAARHDIPGTRVIYEELKPAFPVGRRRQRKGKTENDEGQLELF